MLPIPVLAASLVVLACGTAFAQDAAPPATSSAPVSTMPTPPNLLADIYVARATIEHCKLPIDQTIINRMSEHEKNLEIQLGIDNAAADSGFSEIAAALQAIEGPCEPGSMPLKTLGRVSERYGQAQ